MPIEQGTTQKALGGDPDDDKNEKSNRTYRFSTTQIVIAAITTTALVLGVAASASKAHSAETRVEQQSIALQQLTSEMTAIKALRRDGRLTRKGGNLKWNRALGQVTRGTSSARVAAIERQEAEEKLTKRQDKTDKLERYDDSQTAQRAWKSQEKAERRLEYVNQKLGGKQLVAEKAQALLEARTKQQQRLRDLSKAKEGTEDKSAALKRLAEARITTRQRSAELTQGQTVKVTNKMLHEVTRAEKSERDGAKANVAVEEAQQKESDAQVRVAETEAKGVGRKRAKRAYSLRKQITAAAREVADSAPRVGARAQQATDLLQTLKETMTLLADKQKEPRVPQEVIRALKREVFDLKTSARQAIISRTTAAIAGSNQKIALNKLVLNATHAKLVGAKVKEALASAQLAKDVQVNSRPGNESVPEDVLMRLKEARDQSGLTIRETRAKLKVENQRLERETERVADLKQRLARRQAAEEARQTDRAIASTAAKDQATASTAASKKAISP